MRSVVKTVMLVSPFVPHPPARGIELRIYRLLTWMKQEGYRVVLIVSTDSIDPNSLAKLRAVTFAVHWLRPALRTRIGARFPRARARVWEPIKAIRTLLKSGTESASKEGLEPSNEPHSLSLTMNAPQHLGDAQIKAWFASVKLIELVGRLAQGIVRTRSLSNTFSLHPCSQLSPLVP